MYNSGNTIVSDKTLVMEQEKQYYAFISYKSDDVEWAIWLQHELEHYHLPVIAAD